MKPLNLELTLEQQIELEKIKRSVNKFSKSQLEEYVIELVRQQFVYKNAFRSVV